MASLAWTTGRRHLARASAADCLARVGLTPFKEKLYVSH